MATNTSWLHVMKAEALAKIHLTRRPDLDLLTPSRSSLTGYDLLVRVRETGLLDTPEFGVETKGIDQPLESSRWRSRVLKDLAREADRQRATATDLSLPICLFVFNIDTEEGLYTWLREPIADENSESGMLRMATPFSVTSNGDAKAAAHVSFEKLDRAGLDRIVERVIQWYSVRERRLRQTDDASDRSVTTLR